MILQNQHLFAHNGIKGEIKPFFLQLLLKIFHYVHFMLRLVFPGNSRESRDQAEKFPISREWQSLGNRQALKDMTLQRPIRDCIPFETTTICVQKKKYV
jgi:hypothetical protein